MYQSHFHLHVRPFSSAANPEHYFPASSIEQARESIARNVERDSSVTIVTGPVGCGKTLLCQLISNQYANEMPVCLVQGERLDEPEVLFQSILHKLGIPFRGQDAGELRIILADHISSPGCVNGILLIIDDADRLGSELLDEVRSITNIVKDGQPCARVVLAGSSRLDENLGAPELESLNQRVAGRLYLENFSHHETADYIRARITSSGGDAGALFTEDALNKVQAATHGVPRLVNQICDHALMLASINRVDQLTGQLIEEAWADLQQLPMPTSEYAANNASDELNEAVIEFGELEDPTETSELAGIQEALNDLSVTATRATRPIVVGGDVQFESDVAMEENYENAVLPIRSPLVDDEDLQGSDSHGSHQLDGPTFGAASGGDGASEQFHFEMNEVELGDDDSQTFVFDSSDSIEVNDDAATAPEPTPELENASAEDLMDSVQMQVASGLSELGGEEGEPESEFEFSYETGDDNIVSHGEDAEHHEESESDEQAEQERAEQERAEQERAEQERAEQERAEQERAEQERAEQERAEQEQQDEYQLQQLESEREHEAVAEQASDEELSEKQSHDEHEFTIEQAANPFAVDFAEEEIVVQEFTSPSQLARGEFDPVTTAYSRQLAAQLTAAHPGLRMHPASEIEETNEIDDEQGTFQPLSACMETESYLSSEADESDAAFVGKDDPVMPDPFVQSLVPASQRDHEHEGIVDTQGGEIDSPAIHKEKQPPRKRTRIFRTLFSGMRGK